MRAQNHHVFPASEYVVRVPVEPDADNKDRMRERAHLAVQAGRPTGCKVARGGVPFLPAPESRVIGEQWLAAQGDRSRFQVVRAVSVKADTGKFLHGWRIPGGFYRCCKFH